MDPLYAAYRSRKKFFRQNFKRMLEDLLTRPKSPMYAPKLNEEQLQLALKCIQDMIQIREEFASNKTMNNVRQNEIQDKETTALKWFYRINPS